MQQRGSGEPRHQRRILDRIPKPETAPAKRVMGPVRSASDADRQAHPGAKHPRTNPARPSRVDASLQQRGDRERECNRETDIAEVEERRMKSETGILQDRVEIAPFERRLPNADE